MTLSMQDQIDREFALQEARDRARMLARRGGQPPPPDRREAAVELAAEGLPPPGGWVSPVVDVNRTPLPPVRVSPPNPVKPEAYCKYCGRLFKAKTPVGARLAKGRHEKRDHPHDNIALP